MALLSAAKRLFIPNKNMPQVGQPQYGTDMRAIENFNPINVLTAGSGVTLTPSNGQGPTVEISAASSGASNTGFIVLNAGSDSADYPFTTIHLGPNDDFNSGSGGQGSEFCLFDNASGSSQHYSFAKSWFTFVNPGDSINYLPVVKTPAFTGVATIGISLVMSAQSLDATNLDVESTGASALNQGPSTSVRYPASDYSNVATGGGTDISFIQGTGTSSGSGQISTGGGTPGTESGLYLCSVQLNVTVPTGATF